ncbi:MAG: hypothetical protein A2621_01570 [Alphaproteobacteria bacterium RIFCSPHIGHO2_01_FULL_41_14]|nr:MAG: hypothetical protein A2065_02720 [Alphaproteobacteria bacterium GWB1_45_5]OFW89587.1 MAG: hypothetical protein A2621_01570 [Alphaproteobacteria bacterium RIFCSPHIGHO2_01_FULL_41_14]HCI48502.1 hypothetical protein [Holosporales bacterium]
MRSFFKLFVILILLLSSLSFDGKTAGDQSAEELNRFAAIKINPYDPLGRDRHTDSPVSVLTPYLDNFGHGRIFNYLSENEIHDDGSAAAVKKGPNAIDGDVHEHKRLLLSLKKYVEENRRQFNNKNALVVRLRLVGQRQDRALERDGCLFGVFMSGFDKFSVQSIDNFLRSNLALNERAQKTSASICFRNAYEETAGNPVWYSVWDEMQPFFHPNIHLDDFRTQPEQRENVKVYPVKGLSDVGGVGSRLMPIGCSDRILSEDHLSQLLEDHDGFTVQNLTPEDSLGLSRLISREGICRNLFDSSAYLEDSLPPKLTTSNPRCFLEKRSCAFGDSEQAFIEYLKNIEGSLSPRRNMPHIQFDTPGNDTTITNLTKVSLDLYSYLDVCRFCRGTLSCMLHNGKMADIIGNFLIKAGIIPSDHPPIEGIQIQAFSFNSSIKR